MRTRMIAGLLALCAALFSLSIPVFAGNEEAASPQAGSLGLTAKSAILVEQSTMQVLYEQNPDEKLAPASITKVMTLLLVMEAIDNGQLSYEDTVSCSDYASSMGGSQIWLEPGEQMTVHELLKATAVASANDAAVALAEKIAGTEAAFVDKMNKKAHELGMVNTSFRNCTGLDEDGHYTTARDVAVMAGELLRHPKITEYTSIWMDELRSGETQLVNTNKLVYHYPGTTGLKTGSTDNAGKCLCASANRDGMGLISVVLSAPNADAQFGDSRKLLDYGFGNFMSAPIQSPDSELGALRVLRGVREQAELYTEPPETVVIPRAQEGKLAYEITLPESVTAPVEQNQTVGRVVVHIDSKEICSFPIKTREEVKKMTFLRALGKLGGSLVAMGAPCVE
ncbi:MAG: D-alanyl-D-alanine carboxypeptidase [Clostridiales bacterium]|uniref:D-alanyl-D-alanine carboxypeptidase family protein n=1 Tax=Provencibacterium massiliense TaxID=1841868 RepID=UPI0009A69A66|nr:D-alanyl-D-alanine carboxypeptidase family protein [Provencibacterium massiliense]PWM37070.1 MAG: D-alanyl-D-alanine carboxypeptidase [Clostridiales bacterium]RGB64774.1 D-alanyl-D-alanine carboxypeptidase [Harryflintia acetispora]